MNVIATIRSLRADKKMSQAQLATLAGLSTTYIALVESGKKSTTLISLQKISEALGIPFPILSFMSLDVQDIKPEKRDAYNVIAPAINSMLKSFFEDV